MSHRRVVVCAAISVLAFACGGAPTSPESSASLDGVWRIDYILTTCTGERHCGLVIGQTRQVLARLELHDQSYQGSVETSWGTVDVRGGASNDVVLAGRGPGAVFRGSQLEIVMTLRLRRSGSGLRGAIDYRVTGKPVGDFFGDVSHAGDVVAATRLADVLTQAFP